MPDSALVLRCIQVITVTCLPYDRLRDLSGLSELPMRIVLPTVELCRWLRSLAGVATAVRRHRPLHTRVL